MKIKTSITFDENSGNLVIVQKTGFVVIPWSEIPKVTEDMYTIFKENKE